MRNKNWTWTPASRRALVNLWNEGLPTQEIAKELGPQVTKNMVIGMANRLGLERRSNILPKKYVLSQKLLKMAKPFDQLKASECKFPLGEKMKKPKLFCALPTQEKSPYCPEHHKLCHTKTPGLNK